MFVKVLIIKISIKNPRREQETQLPRAAVKKDDEEVGSAE
jgi:hypothetical protein